MHMLTKPFLLDTGGMEPPPLADDTEGSSKLPVKLLLVAVLNEDGEDARFFDSLEILFFSRTKEETDSVPSPLRRLENLFMMIIQLLKVQLM
jgi:hypothetical protein